MSSAVSVLAQLACLDVFDQERTHLYDLKGWLNSQGYLIDDEITKSSFKLRATTPARFIEAIANDCDRLSMAAFESVASIEKISNFPKSSSWPSIQIYYSAFFAAHSILRIYGRSCSHFENASLQKVIDVAKVLGKSNGLTSIDDGLYNVMYTYPLQSTGGITFSKQKESHIDTWKCFLAVLDELIDKLDKKHVTASSEKILDSLSLLTTIKKGITQSENVAYPRGNWLSAIRNDVNYRQKYGTWFPYNERHLSQEACFKHISNWKNKINHPQLISDDKRESFFELSTLIVSLCRSLIIECSDKVNNKKSVFQYGSLRLLKQIKAI